MTSGQALARLFGDTAMLDLLLTIVLTAWIWVVFAISYALAAACAIALWGAVISALIISPLIGIWDWWHGR